MYNNVSVYSLFFVASRRENVLFISNLRRLHVFIIIYIYYIYTTFVAISFKYINLLDTASSYTCHSLCHSLSKGKKVLGCKWFLTIKYCSDGSATLQMQRNKQIWKVFSVLFTKSQSCIYTKNLTQFRSTIYSKKDKLHIKIYIS